MNATMNSLLDEFQKLPLNDKEYLSEIIQKQLVEAKRDFLADRICEVRENYSKGQTKSGSLEDLKEDLEND